MSVESCIHISNFCYLASYLCRDIFWLRVWTCLGLVFGIVFFTCHSESTVVAASWMSVFLAVNLVQIARVAIERRKNRLNRKQEAISRLMLEEMDREQLMNILTRSLYENRTDPTLFNHSDDNDLDDDARVVRDVAFDRLSKGELVQLIVRRFWKVLRRWRLSTIRQRISQAARRRSERLAESSS